MKHVLSRFRLAALLLVGLLPLGGCAPTLAPPYLDYAASDTEAANRDESLKNSLTQAGWQVDMEAATGLLTTLPRTISHAGIYRTVVYLEVLPLASDRVRVLIHPYRVYFDGARSKLGYLPSGVKREIETPLLEAMRANGYRAEVARPDGT
jgi:hypothetical protein